MPDVRGFLRAGVYGACIGSDEGDIADGLLSLSLADRPHAIDQTVDLFGRRIDGGARTHEPFLRKPESVNDRTRVEVTM